MPASNVFVGETPLLEELNCLCHNNSYVPSLVGHILSDSAERGPGFLGLNLGRHERSTERYKKTQLCCDGNHKIFNLPLARTDSIEVYILKKWRKGGTT